MAVPGQSLTRGQRLTKLPIIIVGVVTVLFGFGVFYAAMARQKPPANQVSFNDEVELKENTNSVERWDFPDVPHDGLVTVAPYEPETENPLPLASTGLAPTQNIPTSHTSRMDIDEKIAEMIKAKQLSALERNQQLQDQIIQQQFAMAQDALSASTKIEGFGQRDQQTTSMPMSVQPGVGSSTTTNEAALLEAVKLSNTNAAGTVINQGYVDRDYRHDFKLHEELQHPESRYQLQTGTLIPGVMISAASNELPGDVVAQVRRDVYDSVTGRYLLIPKGAKLLGKYSPYAGMGQERLLMVWDRLQLPNGTTYTLGANQGYDLQGIAGNKDIVKTHFLKTLLNAFLLSVVDSTGEIIEDEVSDANNIVTSISNNFGGNMERVWGRYLEERLRLQPTLVIRSGYRFNLVVRRDMRFPGAYRHEIISVKGG